VNTYLAAPAARPVVHARRLHEALGDVPTDRVRVEHELTGPSATVRTEGGRATPSAGLPAAVRRPSYRPLNQVTP